MRIISHEEVLRLYSKAKTVGHGDFFTQSPLSLKKCVILKRV